MSRGGPFLVFAFILAEPVFGATFGGRVLDERSGSAVPSASIRIRQSGSPTFAAEVETDAEGRFEVPDLPEGNYRVEASKRNFVSSISDLRLPAADASGKGGFTFWLIRCGSISGQVADQAGEPVAGATVFAYPRPAENQPLSRLSRKAYSALANEKGDYRVSGLPPGEYIVAVSWSGSDIVRSRMRVSPAAAGKFGSGLMFYPANAEIEVVNVSGGGERLNTDFTVLALGLQELSGKVEISEPEARFDVALVLPSLPSVTISATQTAAEGLFRFDGVPAGSYEIIARGATTGSGLVPLFARTRVEIAGQATGPVTLIPRPGQSIVVRLRSAEEPLPQACPKTVALTLTPASNWRTQQTLRVNVSIGRETTVPNMAPDQYSISAQNLPEGCYIAGNSMLDLREAPSGSLVTVTLAEGGAINGRVMAGKRILSDVSVILVPSDIEFTTRAVFPGQDGRFSFSHLPPGSYRIGARLLGGTAGDSETQTMFPIEVPSRGTVEVDLPVYEHDGGRR